MRNRRRPIVRDRDQRCLDHDGRRRGFRYVVFDVFGTVVSRDKLEDAHRSSDKASKAMWAFLNAFDSFAHTLAAIKKAREYAERDFAELEARTLELEQKVKGLEAGSKAHAPQPPKCSRESDRPTAQDEIEVTPKTIEAGMMLFREWEDQNAEFIEWSPTDSKLRRLMKRLASLFEKEFRAKMSLGKLSSKSASNVFHRVK